MGKRARARDLPEATEDGRTVRAGRGATDGEIAPEVSPSGVATTAAEDLTIRETPGIGGGYPRIGGTRVAVRHVVEVFRLTGGDFERTWQMYPQLTREQVRLALDYYQAHPARVDEDIERNARTMAELEGRRWPD